MPGPKPFSPNSRTPLRHHDGPNPNPNPNPKKEINRQRTKILITLFAGYDRQKFYDIIK